MLYLVLGTLLALIAVVLWVLKRTYQHVPQHELKRIARHGDPAADLLYRAVAYGASLRVLLNGGIIICGSLSLAAFATATNVWWALLIVLVLLGVGSYIFVPSDQFTRSGLWLAQRMAPSIAWVLERSHPFLNALITFVQRRKRVHVHTGVYEKEDLVTLLEQQKGQPDNRIPESEVALLQHALTFGDKLVCDALVPKRVVKMVASSDVIGPVLMDELNKSGHSRFPVYDGTQDNIVGILYLHDLVGVKHGGIVADVMSHKLTYVHEDFTLYQALQAFLKTKRHLFLVVNSFEELVGVITIEDVIEQMIGAPIMDEFDKYDDLRAVAAAAARKEHTEHKKEKTEPVVEPAESEPTSDAKEVVK